MVNIWIKFIYDDSYLIKIHLKAAERVNLSGQRSGAISLSHLFFVKSAIAACRTCHDIRAVCLSGLNFCIAWARG